MSEPIQPLYFEHLIAPILGLTRDNVRYLRTETGKKGRDWWKEGREVVITRAGLDLILDRLQSTSNDAPSAIDFTPALVTPPDSEKKSGGAGELEEEPAPADQGADQSPPDPSVPAAEPAGRPDLLELTVKSCYPNPRMLRARTAGGAVVDVRVRNNKNFTPGMKLKARLGTGGRYDMEGRCPRRRGRY